MGHSVNGKRELSGSNSCHHHDVDRQRMLRPWGLNARANLTLELSDERFPEEVTGGRRADRKQLSIFRALQAFWMGPSGSFMRGALEVEAGVQAISQRPWGFNFIARATESQSRF